MLLLRVREGDLTAKKNDHRTAFFPIWGLTLETRDVFRVGETKQGLSFPVVPVFPDRGEFFHLD